jgi:DNA modification methylase
MKPKISNFCSLCGAWKGSFGLEPNPELYIQHSVAIFCEVKRVLRPDGTLWLNIGDSYARMQEGNVPQTKNKECQPPLMSGRVKNAGMKAKDLVGVPWMLAFALRADGWYLRSEIIWSKPSPMPESVLDRPTKAHEQIFLLSKKSRYFYNAEAIKEPSVMNPQNRFTARANHPKGDKGRPMHRRPEGGTGDTSKRLAEQAIIRTGGLITGGVENSSLGISAPENRNKRSVWEVATKPFPEAHFAVYPEELIKPCVLAGCPAGGVVLDPFGGAMTTMLVAQNLQCKGIAIELNAEYIEIGIRRLSQEVFDFI